MYRSWIDWSKPPYELIAANFLVPVEKLSYGLLLKFGSCRSVEQPLPANVGALTQLRRLVICQLAWPYFFVITAKLQQLNRIATVEILFVRRNCVNAMLGVDRLAHRRQRSWSCVPAVVVRCWQLHSVLLPRSFECVIAINRRFTLWPSECQDAADAS